MKSQQVQCLITVLFLALIQNSCGEGARNLDAEGFQASSGDDSLEIVGNNGNPESAFPLGKCQGDCDDDSDCQGHLKCFQRDGGEAIPGCPGGLHDKSRTDYCYDPGFDGHEMNVLVGNNGSPSSAFPLGKCQADCDNDAECRGSLKCFQRSDTEPVPGCDVEGVYPTEDFCYDPDSGGDEVNVLVGNNGIPESAFPLRKCQADCDRDSECGPTLKCFQRSDTEPVPGCDVEGLFPTEDFCYDPNQADNNGCKDAQPGARDYCEKCGPCAEGQGDCDPGQCADGLTCHEEGSIDRCRSTVPGGRITVVNTTKIRKVTKADFTIAVPKGTRQGDLLVFAVHRTDAHLQVRFEGWNTIGTCFKRSNGDKCWTLEECTEWTNDKLCRRFGGHTRVDLTQVIAYRLAGSNEPDHYTFDLRDSIHEKETWAFLTALRGADTWNPLRDWSHKGCDGSSKSKFPSVKGVRGDMILLSQSFDDRVENPDKFGAPDGMTQIGHIWGGDDAGFLFAGELKRTGATGTMETKGSGASSCKDALISILIRAK